LMLRPGELLARVGELAPAPAEAREVLFGERRHAALEALAGVAFRLRDARGEKEDELQGCQRRAERRVPPQPQKIDRQKHRDDERELSEPEHERRAVPLLLLRPPPRRQLLPEGFCLIRFHTGPPISFGIRLVL